MPSRVLQGKLSEHQQKYICCEKVQGKDIDANYN